MFSGIFTTKIMPCVLDGALGSVVVKTLSYKPEGH
jgi:hypothetical protein